LLRRRGRLYSGVGRQPLDNVKKRRRELSRIDIGRICLVRFSRYGAIAARVYQAMLVEFAGQRIKIGIVKQILIPWRRVLARQFSAEATASVTVPAARLTARSMPVYNFSDTRAG
jgi:hypothetical protein